MRHVHMNVAVTSTQCGHDLQTLNLQNNPNLEGTLPAAWSGMRSLEVRFGKRDACLLSLTPGDPCTSA